MFHLLSFEHIQTSRLQDGDMLFLLWMETNAAMWKRLALRTASVDRLRQRGRVIVDKSLSPGKRGICQHRAHGYVVELAAKTVSLSLRSPRPIQDLQTLAVGPAHDLTLDEDASPSQIFQ